MEPGRPDVKRPHRELKRQVQGRALEPSNASRSCSRSEGPPPLAAGFQLLDFLSSVGTPAGGRSAAVAGERKPSLEELAVDTASPFSAPGTKQSRWDTKVFRDIKWRRFEAVCARLLTQAGFEARTQSHGADGGVDIWLYSKNAEGLAAIVQCKLWGRQVGVAAG